MEQMSLFDGSKKFVVDKPIRLISLFSGYDSQEFALKYLGVNYEHWKTCEWAVKSIQALKDAHYKNDNIDYSADHSQEFIINQLFKWGISANYNEPMTKEQIKRLGEQKQRQIYNNIMATHNLVNIQQVSADRLEIVDKDKYCYLMTYSFPCQDLSKAGKGAGMEKGSGTRSGLLWEVERILDECKETDQLPQILLMENVPDVIGSKNISNFAKWLEKLEKLGYHCYWKVLNAKDYGIPQNRERCFMISLLGDYYYEFPQPIKLEHRLKDLLEDNVDEKYYLSDKMVQYIANNNDKWTGNNDKSIINRDVAVTINTRVGNTRADCSDYLCKELPENYNLKTKNKRQQELANKIDTSKDGQFLDFYNQITNDYISGTITTRVDASNSSAVYNNYRIRKLTPKECGRLQGLKDIDIDKIQKFQSNASCYHLYGDSICVPVLMAIFSNMLGLDYTEFLDFNNW